MLTLADSEVVRRAPAIPGLGLLLDPESFVAALECALPGVDLGIAQITYVNYKPGVKCIVGYQLQLGTATVELYAKAMRVDARSKLRRVRKHSAVQGPLGPGRMVLDDHAIAVFVFPNDRRVKALNAVADPELRRCLLREVMPDRPDTWDGTIRRLHYRPEVRYVAQLLDGGTPQAALKVYAEPCYRAAITNSNAFHSRGPLRIVREIGHSSRHCALLFEWQDGCLLRGLLAEPQFKLGTVATVGAALAELHAQEPNGLRRRMPRSDVAKLLSVRDELGALCADFAGCTHDLAERLASRLLAEPLLDRPIHGDFSAQQILVDGDKVAFLDFDTAARGNPASDLGNFIAKLERAVIHGKLSPDRLKLVHQALLDGYRAVTRGPIPGCVELHTAASLFRFALHPFRRRMTNWPEQTQAILARVDAILNGTDCC
jgi:hypothetical protein